MPKKSIKDYTNKKAAEAKAAKVGTKLNNDILEATLPVGEENAADVAAMLSDRGFIPSEWVITNLTVNEWDSPTGEVLKQTKATLKRNIPKADTAWGQFITSLHKLDSAPIQTKKKKLALQSKTKTLVLLGDYQAPFINDKLHELTLHFLADIKPTGLVLMGDIIDFPNISRHRPDDKFFATVQESIDFGYRLCSELKDAAKLTANDELVFLVGNHEIRLDRILLDKLPQLFGIKKADVGEDDKSVLHLANLLRLDELGYHYVADKKGDYPHGTYKIADNFYASHGWIARAGAGASAQASIQNLNASIAVGHTHRLALSHKTRWEEDTPFVYSAIETGTMARPLGYTRFPDWQNGFVVLQVVNGVVQPEMVSYLNGSLYWRNYEWKFTQQGIKTNWK